MSGDTSLVGDTYVATAYTYFCHRDSFITDNNTGMYKLQNINKAVRHTYNIQCID